MAPPSADNIDVVTTLNFLTSLPYITNSYFCDLCFAYTNLIVDRYFAVGSTTICHFTVTEIHEGVFKLAAITSANIPRS